MHIIKQQPLKYQKKRPNYSPDVHSISTTLKDLRVLRESTRITIQGKNTMGCYPLLRSHDFLFFHFAICGWSILFIEVIKLIFYFKKRNKASLNW